MNRNIQLIISHPGKTHRDDFLAIGLIQSLCERLIPLERRDPTPDELGDPNVAVVDVGGIHNPEMSCFDHHQFPAGTKECAFSLVAKAYNVENLLSRFDWYYITTLLDSCGPLAVAKHYQLPELPFGLSSPIENAVLNFTRQSPSLEAEIAKKVTDAILEEGWETEENLIWLREHARLEEVEGVPFIWAKIRQLNELARDEFRKEKASEFATPIAVQIHLDSRNQGMTLYRFDDDPRIDFRQIKEDPKVLFVHSNGFVAKTKEQLSLETCRELIARSIVRDVSKETP